MDVKEQFLFATNHLKHFADLVGIDIDESKAALVLIWHHSGNDDDDEYVCAFCSAAEAAETEVLRKEIIRLERLFESKTGFDVVIEIGHACALIEGNCTMEYEWSIGYPYSLERAFCDFSMQVGMAAYACVAYLTKNNEAAIGGKAKAKKEQAKRHAAIDYMLKIGGHETMKISDLTSMIHGKPGVSDSFDMIRRAISDHRKLHSAPQNADPATLS